MWIGPPTSNPCAQGARVAVVFVESLERRTLLAAGDPFTVVMMPDTQIYAWKYPEIFDSQTKWVANNTAAQKFAFLTHVGDVVENPSSMTEWTRADTYIDKFDTVPLPYSIAIGNHDYEGTSSAKFVQHFGKSRYAGRNWYGDASSNQLNHWQIFTGGAWNFLHIALEYNPSASSLSWAQSVINAHPGMPTMVTTHDYISTSLNRSSIGTRVWDGLIRKNPQIFFVFNGHYTGEAHRVVTNDAGKPVVEMVVDFQGHTNGGNGYLRMLKFVPTANRIEATTYSPWLNQSYTDANSQFTITMDFNSRFGTPQQGQGGVSANEVLVPATNTGTNESPRRAPAARPTSPFSATRIAQARKPVDVLRGGDDAVIGQAA